MRHNKGPKSKPKIARVHHKKLIFKGFDNTRDLNAILSRTKIFQDILGISTEGLTALYEQALGLYESGRIEESQGAFTFLTKINPFAADFWIGLGMCHLQLEEHEKAFDALIMALTMEPDRYECYAYAIDACVKLKNYAQAEALLRQAVTYARRHPSHEDSSVILEEAPRLLKEIAREKTSTMP
jgi:tetratricopeptide (TPR) repeat protein